MNVEEMNQLENAIEEIVEIAKKFQLDFYPMRYEICPADIIYTFGAYGMPTRFSHWSFGKTFHKMKTQYDLGLSKIYELVINSNPCYAFLLDGNSLIQNKLIVAHVLAHCDFFKNNAHFSNTNRDMINSMSSTSERIHNYEYEHGTENVEKFIDAVLAIQEHVDPSLFRKYNHHQKNEPANIEKQSKGKTGFEDLWDLEQNQPSEESKKTKTPEKTEKKFPTKPEKDIMWFIEEHSPILEDWQRDILSMLREEMLYFWPQIQTKIMNEGWASYWHVRILREMDLTSAETIEFAKLNSSVVQPSQHTLNPYYLGLKIFEDIEKRFDREKIFEVREIDSDTSFIRNYLTKDLVEDLDLYIFEKQGREWKITDKTWENIRDQLVSSRTNGGFPYLVVKDGNYKNNGELYIKHEYEGLELDLKYTERTLPYLQQLWGKNVHLETKIEDKPVVFSFKDQKMQRRFL
ncbi:SpoVR family protein [Chengkuizengella axinellae]|uniref:SpoVR family protein n=1 Tax=Chengkuizengella axinellae TaxID=3064388 RepID=A0ABT9J0M5_9BACL|nr:SpoVR family protein [Chengkuizengella sp. 2205SS18-9]MDP5275120.1 SpoVR family protein [Chengkuizengella sp. 2205SS18-9]